LILGPAVGGILGQFNLQAPAYVAAGLAFLNVLLGIFILPESLSVSSGKLPGCVLKDFKSDHCHYRDGPQTRPGLAVIGYRPVQFRI